MQYLNNSKLWAVIAGALASIAVMGTGVKTWAEVLSPPFVFGALGALATAITALHLDKPNA